MGIAALSFIGAVGLGAAVVAANAAPSIPSPVTQQETNIVRAAPGCGWGLHPNRWGHCIPNRYASYRGHRLLARILWRRMGFALRPTWRTN
jgi:hypothetical protein